MICPSTRLLMLAVLNAVPDPNPVRYTGTSGRWTGATATDTARGAAACACCCFESTLLQAVRLRHSALSQRREKTRATGINLESGSSATVQGVFLTVGFRVGFLARAGEA